MPDSHIRSEVSVGPATSAPSGRHDGVTAKHADSPGRCAKKTHKFKKKRDKIQNQTGEDKETKARKRKRKKMTHTQRTKMMKTKRRTENFKDIQNKEQQTKVITFNGGFLHNALAGTDRFLFCFFRDRPE